MPSVPDAHGTIPAVWFGRVLAASAVQYCPPHETIDFLTSEELDSNDPSMLTRRWHWSGAPAAWHPAGAYARPLISST